MFEEACLSVGELRQSVYMGEHGGWERNAVTGVWQPTDEQSILALSCDLLEEMGADPTASVRGDLLALLRRRR